MTSEDWVFLMRDKLDKIRWVMLGAGDYVRLTPASAVNAVGMVAPFVHSRRSYATRNPVIRTLLFADSFLAKDESDFEAIPLRDHGLALDSLPFVAAKANDLDYFGNTASDKLLTILFKLLCLEDAGAKSHTIVSQCSLVQFNLFNASAVRPLRNRQANPGCGLFQKSIGVRVLFFGIVKEQNNFFAGILSKCQHSGFRTGDTARKANDDLTHVSPVWLSSAYAVLVVLTLADSSKPHQQLRPVPLNLPPRHPITAW
jgi:hypothetical protein